MNAPHPVATPPLPPQLPPETGDATGGVIPYNHPHALTAYYLGVFSLVPLLGAMLALGAVPLGISGLMQRKKNPAIRGFVHTWIGVMLGSISLFGHRAIQVIACFG